MQAVDIVNRIKEILPFYTDDFSDISSVTSLTRSSTTITAVTPSVHGLTTGDYVTLRGAKEPITLTSLTRVDNIVTVVSSTSHKLSDPSLYSPSQLPLLVEISGASPSEYNGSFTLLTVADDNTFTFQITDTPTSPATTAGFLLLEDQDGFNGYKQVTVSDTLTFTYETTNTSLGTPAQGTLEMSNATRIDAAATADRILEFYSENASGLLQNWILVVTGPKTIYKDDTVADDPSSAQKKNQSYWYEGIQTFSVYIIIPSKNSVLGGVEADLARTYENPLLKSIANFIFDSELTEEVYQPTIYTLNETDDYIKAYYVHRYDFQAKGFIQQEDTAAFNNGVPLQLVDGTITDKDMTYKPLMR